MAQRIETGDATETASTGATTCASPLWALANQARETIAIEPGHSAMPCGRKRLREMKLYFHLTPIDARLYPMNLDKSIPFPVAEALPKLGATIRTARIRRRRKAADFARRLDVSLPTLRKLEAGDPGVSLGKFVTALWLLDLLPAVLHALDPAADEVGLTLDLARMPKRVRRSAEVDLADL
jgi:DNA-binding XRE family transcriptional regulator